MNNIKEYLQRTINIILLFLFIWIIVALCIANRIDYACKINWKISNIGLIIASLLIIYLYCKKVKERAFQRINMNRLVLIATIVLFFLEVYICYNIFFETGWDSGAYIIPAARALLGKLDVTSMNEAYFKTYPNNLFLVHIYYALLRINEKLGVFTGAYQLMVIIVFNCAISSMSCWLTYIITRKYASIKYSLLGYILAVALLGVSPWNVICYSDAIALFFPIFIMYIYTEDRINIYVRSFIILVAGYLGYCIKPQAAIVIIAIIIAELLKITHKYEKSFWIKEGAVILCSVTLIAVIAGGLKNLYNTEGFEQDKNRQFGLTHFFMMGLNPEYRGVWSGEDVEISANCKTAEQRRETNLEVSKKRLNNYGITGYAKFLTKKMLTNYNNGTYAWGAEGSFYAIVPDNNSRMSHFLKNIYYNDGKYYGIYSQVVQLLWVMVLAGVAISSILGLKRKPCQSNIQLILQLCIIGITLFELLFEARARYLYLYVPVYILLFVLNGDYLEGYLKKKSTKK